MFVDGRLASGHVTGSDARVPRGMRVIGCESSRASISALVASDMTSPSGVGSLRARLGEHDGDRVVIS